MNVCEYKYIIFGMLCSLMQLTKIKFDSEPSIRAKMQRPYSAELRCVHGIIQIMYVHPEKQSLKRECKHEIILSPTNSINTRRFGSWIYSRFQVIGCIVIRVQAQYSIPTQSWGL